MSLLSDEEANVALTQMASGPARETNSSLESPLRFEEEVAEEDGAPEGLPEVSAPGGGKSKPQPE